MIFAITLFSSFMCLGCAFRIPPLSFASFFSSGAHITIYQKNCHFHGLRYTFEFKILKTQFHNLLINFSLDAIRLTCFQDTKNNFHLNQNAPLMDTKQVNFFRTYKNMYILQFFVILRTIITSYISRI